MLGSETFITNSVFDFAPRYDESTWSESPTWSLQPRRWQLIKTNQSASRDSHVLSSQNIHSAVDATFQEQSDPFERAINAIVTFADAPLTTDVYRWLLHSGLAESVGSVLKKLYSLFPESERRIRLNSDAQLVIVVNASPEMDIDASLDALDRFDFEWWLRQDEHLRGQVLVLLA